MGTAIPSAYAQMLSVGLLWTSLHCVGMCGPLVVGLGLGHPRAGRSPLTQLAAYQLGKGTLYAAFGGLAGLLGQAVSTALERMGPYLAGALGLALVLGTLARNLLGHRARTPPLVATLAQPLGRLQRSRLSPLVRAYLLGTLMAWLPCMLVLWALTLAASTGSPLHGAAVMLLLVAMNSVPLALASQLPSALAHRLPRAAALGPWLGALSGTWLLLVSTAAAGFIPHASLGFGLGGRGYVVMFW